MGSYKVVVVLLAFLVAYCAGVAIDPRITDSHNIDQCDETTSTERLLSTNIYEPAKLLLPVTRTLTYPQNGINSRLITCLKVINTDPANHGGYPHIVSGGVGAYDVQLSFKSQWGQPLNFKIEIWAAK